MNYSFCDYTFSIDIIPFLQESKYDVFRHNNIDADCLIKTEVSNELNIPNIEPVFQNQQGLNVIKDGSVEYRYYRNFVNGEIAEVLIDNGEQKKLQMLAKTKNEVLTEMGLINRLAFEKTLSEHGRFVLHSSYIQTNKGAILFTAPSGTGKSTQADLWNRHRETEIINGDRAGIWKDGDRWMAGGVPWCGTSGIMKNKTMLLRAIVILEQGTENKIKEMRFVTKIGRLMKQITINPWNREMMSAAQMFCMELCQEIPVIVLSCQPNIGAVELLEKNLPDSPSVHLQHIYYN